MPTYLFSIARKWWDRIDISIEAESEEAAKKKIDEEYESFIVEEEIDPATLSLIDWDDPDLVREE